MLWAACAASACAPAGALTVDGATSPDDDPIAPDPVDARPGDTDAAPARCDGRAGMAPGAGFTPAFRAFLDARGRGDLARDDVDGGAFGGLDGPDDCALRRPVVFVHGNGDRALGGPLGGWTVVRDALVAAGWRSAELYATTYGPADPLRASIYGHDRASLGAVRALLEAALDHTGAAQIDVVGHSLGVTMARRAILGGPVRDRAGVTWDLGPPLTGRVHTFVGMAGANLGLASCTNPAIPVCDREVGLYPGVLVGTEVVGRSAVLEDLLAAPGTEGARRVAMWSAADEVVGFACIVWGANTCQIPAQTGEIRYARRDHLGVRDDGAADLVAILGAP